MQTAFSRHIYDFLDNFLSGRALDAAVIPTSLICIAALAFLSYFLCIRILTPTVHYITGKTPTGWDNDLINHKLLSALSQLAPVMIISWLLPQVANGHVKWTEWLTKFSNLYIVYTLVVLVNVFITNLYNGFERRGMYRGHNLSVLVQALSLVAILVGCVIGLSIIFGQSPFAVLTALGASAAILMLVFKDTIMGLVAGVQLSVNGMLHKGDWIVSEKAGANGEVLDVKLTTVKIRNWDNSITTIPPYNLISDSFQNYQNMRRAGARRVARSIYIDVNTIGFLDEEQIDHLRERGWLAGIDTGNAARKVNISIFRRYLEHYLAENPLVRLKDKNNPAIFMMVRQLAPPPQGLPLELYFFTKETNWKKFENIQSDIFDHVYAALPHFGLRMFQVPSGYEFFTDLPAASRGDAILTPNISKTRGK